MDWDSDVEDWNPVCMGQWPFGNPFPEIELMQREVLDCLDRLDSDLDFEEWLMDQEEDTDDAFDNDDVDDQSENEGYLTDEESYSEDDNEWGNVGIAPMLMNIFF